MLVDLKKEQILNIGVVGLGLVGGSLSKALKKYTSHNVYGCDIDPDTIQAAFNAGAIDFSIEDGDFSMCDLVFIALYPQKAVEFVKAHSNRLKENAIVMDLCGIKRYVVKELSPLAEENHFIYVGGHPMAGKESWGFQDTDGDLFRGASMIITPSDQTPVWVLDLLIGLFADIRFKTVNRTTPESHDSMIAFTSQLAHVVSSSYIKSPRALAHNGFSAGSYKDLTRVAKLNPNMWTELFLENKDYLTEEIDTIVAHLLEYKQAISTNNYDSLYTLLAKGSEIKEGLDK